MILIYFIIGLFASILGALPLGASNIAVINTTIKQNTFQAFKIIFSAGIAEILLSLYALHCATVVQSFVNNHIWIQFAIATIFLGVGSYLLLKKQALKRNKLARRKLSKYVLGFILGILNPPVLIYWIVAIGFINNHDFMLSLQSSYAILFLFFLGIYLGKIATLYTYSRFSHFIKNKNENITLVINKVTGVLLIFIGLSQVAKFYFI